MARPGSPQPASLAMKPTNASMHIRPCLIRGETLSVSAPSGLPAARTASRPSAGPAPGTFSPWPRSAGMARPTRGGTHLISASRSQLLSYVLARPSGSYTVPFTEYFPIIVLTSPAAMDTEAR